MGKALLVVVPVVLAIYCLIQVLQARHGVRGLPRWAWAVLIIMVPLVGAIAWLVLGRPQRGRPPQRPQRRTIAPDDDPDFLRGLDYRQPRDPTDD
ncbi:MAG: hypothetical protein GEU96_03155 [Propionibacteriales bacterium]|nr:hypothetical protein [Propionibacteriales bacterium]